MSLDVLKDPPKKKPRARRSYAEDWKALETYIQASVDVLESIQLDSEQLKGQKTALAGVLARMKR